MWLRTSAWSELVRGDELDKFLLLAEQASIKTLEQLDGYCSLAKNHTEELRDLARNVQEKQGNESYSLFDRPLFVLSVVILLENPVSRAYLFATRKPRDSASSDKQILSREIAK